MIYLDNAATTQIEPKVLEEMMPYLTDQFGNPGTLYSLGRRARDAIEKAREQVANLIGAEPDQIIFTSGGTEGNNMVFSMMSQYMRQRGKNHIAVSSIEHDSVLKAAQKLADNHGFEVTQIPVNHTGCIELETMQRELKRNTGFVSIMHTNNEISVINSVRDLAKIAHNAGALFHTDCVQTLGSEPIDVRRIDCDFATISAHKIHGPKGVGAVYIKDKRLFGPMICGGYGQEFGIRGGTENVAGIVGFGKACELIYESDRMKALKYIDDLKNAFSSRLFLALLDYGLEDDLKINGAHSQYGTNVMNFRVDGIDAESLILMLDNSGVCISAGSACNSQEQVPSHVLKAIGLSDDQARQSFRVSFSRMNKLPEVENAGCIVAECISALKGL